jgi:predicted nucleic acid-binding protein
MISFDTNLLFYAFDADSVWNPQAYDFFATLALRSDVIVSEFMLVEFYRLLRNPTLMKKPLTASEAADVIGSYRKHPRWRRYGFPENSSGDIHDQLWRIASIAPFAYRRIYDARFALTILKAGVTEFATVNVKDFEGLGFRRVWNPLED